MRILVTGAAGFLGRYVVREALSRGHEVVAGVRPATDVARLSWSGHERVSLHRSDLRRPDGLTDALRGVDAVVHLAAVKSGDLYAQLSGTVVGTENLLGALRDAGVRRLVVTSTLSVYDFLAVRSFSRLDESSPLETAPLERETYCQSKLVQEDLVRRAAAEQGLALTVLRPGFIIGPGSTWTDQVGLRLGERRWLRFTAGGMPMQLTYVENCADAVVDVVEHDATIGETLNVIDSDLPTRARYSRELARRSDGRAFPVPLPGWVARSFARAAWLVRATVFRGRAKLPWFASPPKLAVQIKGLRYSSERLRELTGWEPRVGFQEAMDRCFGGEGA